MGGGGAAPRCQITTIRRGVRNGELGNRRSRKRCPILMVTERRGSQWVSGKGGIENPPGNRLEGASDPLNEFDGLSGKIGSRKREVQKKRECLPEAREKGT